jgi:hypothetical protein
MAKYERKDREEKQEVRHREKPQSTCGPLKKAVEPEDSQEKQALAEISVTEQVSLVKSPQVPEAQRAKAILNLQQTYGNRYVQGLVEGGGKATLDEHIMCRIESQRGSGKPLDHGVRSQMEGSFGHNFGDVKIHTSVEANALSQQLEAKAFTTGKDMFFREGAYEPHSETGIKLIAHELTHVIQQSGSLPIQRQVSEKMPAAPPAKNAAPSSEEALETAGAEEPEVPTEAIEPLPEVACVSEDLAPKESQAAETGVMAASAGLAPTPVSHQLISPDHPSEREAEAISRTIMFSEEKGNRPRISHISSAAMNMIQRQLIYWETQNTVGWGDFKAGIPKGALYDAMIYTGWKGPASLKTFREAHPYPPIIPETCKIGRKATTKFSAVVGFDLPALNIKGYMNPAKSWSKPGKQSAALLAHEQGHFDIANVIAEKVEMAIMIWDIKQDTSATACGKKGALNAATKKWNAAKPNKAIKQISKSGVKIFNQVNSSTGDYDTGTVHGTDAAGQKAWEGKIAAGLPDYEIPLP